MSTVKHIVVATDGSDLSKRAAAYGGDLARAFDARVTVITVHDEQSVIPAAWNAVGLKFEGQTSLSTEDVRRQIEENALKNELAETASSIGDISAGTKQVNLWGHPADQICDYAADHDADMIVMGSHGRTGVKRALLGSVCHSVANRAPCAVTIVK